MTFNLYLWEPGVTVAVDRTARPIALRAGPVSGAVMARGMVETLWQPSFDGDYLHLDAFGLMGVKGWIERYCRHRSPAARLARLQVLVGNAGMRDAMLVEIDRLLDGDETDHGEPSFVRGRIIDQMASGAAHVTGGPRWFGIAARLSAAQL